MKATLITSILLAATLPVRASANAQTRSNDHYNRSVVDPRQAAAYGRRGDVKLDKRDLDGAAADFNRALQLDPTLGAAYAGRGDVKFWKHDIDGAITDYSRAIKLNPHLATTYVSRGNAEVIKGDLGGAMADYNQALKVNSQFVDHVYLGRGNVNFLNQNWTDALRDYRHFCELWKRDQDYPRLLIWLIRSRLGDREAANNELAAYFKAHTGWPRKIAAYLLGNLSETDLFAAASRATSGKTAREQSCEAWFYAGMKNLLMGNKPAAADCFKKCLATEQLHFYEYQFAKAELKALGR